MQSLFFSPPPFENEEIKNNITVKCSNSYEMKSILSSGQNK